MIVREDERYVRKNTVAVRQQGSVWGQAFCIVKWEIERSPAHEILSMISVTNTIPAATKSTRIKRIVVVRIVEATFVLQSKHLDKMNILDRAEKMLSEARRDELLAGRYDRNLQG